jgi:hypothetical protein
MKAQVSGPLRRFHAFEVADLPVVVPDDTPIAAEIAWDTDASTTGHKMEVSSDLTLAVSSC